MVKESRVYILDNTMSHQANNGFAHDRVELIRNLTGAGREVQIAVVELTSQPRVIGSFGDDRGGGGQKLGGFGSRRFNAALISRAFHQANSLLANSFGERKKIILYGD